VPLQDLTPQLRTRLRRMERLVGLFVVAAAVLLLVGFAYYLYRTAESRGWFVEKCPYYTFVSSAEGLEVGGPVLLMGFSVGQITRIEAQPPGSYYNVFIGFEVRRPYYGYIWTDSKVRITSGDLLGGRRIEITKGTAGQPTAYEVEGRVREVLVDGKRVPLAEAPQGVGIEPIEAPSLTDRAQQLIGQVEEALPKILEQVESVLGNANRLTDDVDQLVNEARPVLANVREITGNLRNPEGSLGEWLLTSELREGLDTALANVNADLEALNETLTNLGRITGSLRTQVEANDQILGEVSSLVVEADDLVKGLKRHWLLKSAFPASRRQTPPPVLEPLLGAPSEDAP
jgi:ABC-type transporter Mla subunit MlaD